nr:immunoglobulin heavy chain junction region [Mus musculus]
CARQGTGGAMDYW